MSRTCVSSNKPPKGAPLGDALNITPNPLVPKITPEIGDGVAVGNGVVVGEMVGETVDVGIIVAVPV